MHTNTLPHVATRLAGKPLAEALLAQIPAACRGLPRAPKLVVVRVGDNPASAVYVRHKLAACAKVGIAAEEINLHATESEANLHSLLHGLAQDDGVDAIIVQLPLPEGWDTRAALDMVPAEKDCDGLSAANMALRERGDPRAILPATPVGVMRLLQHVGQPVAGVTVAVVGNGLVVGNPLRAMLSQAGANVVAIDRDTAHPQALSRTAQVLVSAAGAPHMIHEHWVHDGAVVVDVGLTRVEHGGAVVLRGDVDTARVAPVARYLTPVPGGVGPMTVASLLTNIVECACVRANLPKPDWAIPVFDKA